MALGLCIQFIDLLTRRNIEQTPFSPTGGAATQKFCPGLFITKSYNPTVAIYLGPLTCSRCTTTTVSSGPAPNPSDTSKVGSQLHSQSKNGLF
jgi:hypothetical protein